ncbi:MAG: S-layer homology domain-containing protein [Lachnospiraceae bacterium]
MKKTVRFMTSVAAVAVATAAIPFSAEASSNFEMRKKVVTLSGILTSKDTNQYITRGEFARMLVNASSYKESASATTSMAVFNDVPASNEYASYIRIATNNGWMKAYLGGQFKPDQQITLQEAARGVLALLGYTNDDFAGDQNGARWNKYTALDLGNEISKQSDEVLTWTDAVNLFYNTLCADAKNGTAYAKTLGYEMSSDGEVNALSLMDNTMKGPKLVKRSHRMDDAVPFDLSDATFYLDGKISTLSAVKQAKDNGFVVLYYNTNSKTVWAYSSEEIGGTNQTGKVAIEGEITGIYYNSTDVMTPSSLQLDNDENVQFKLSSSDVQFAFSIYGDYQVGDKIVLICDATTNADGDVSYTVVDYVEY